MKIKTKKLAYEKVLKKVKQKKDKSLQNLLVCLRK